MDGRYLSVQGVQVYYEVGGAGPPLLLLHGGLGSNADFASILPELSKHFKVVAFERTGNARTADTDAPFSYQSMAEQTIGVVESLGLHPCHIAGWSDGAIVGLLVALQRPELVTKLIYISGNFDQTGLTPGMRKWIEALTSDSFRRDVPEMAKVYDDLSPDGPSHFPALVEKTKRLWLTEPNLTREDLSKLTVPTLVVGADRDVIPIEHLAETARAIHGAQLLIVPGTTHSLMNDKPKMIADAMVDFLEKA